MRKILMVSIGKSFGGLENTILTIINTLNNKFEFYLCVRKNTKLSEVAETLLDKNHILSLSFTKKTLLKDCKRIRDYCKCNSIDVVHCHGIGALAFCSLDRYIMKKCVYTIHGDTDFDRMERSKFQRWCYRKIEVFGMKKAKLNIAVSNDIKIKIVSRGIKDSKVKVVYNGILLDNWIPKTYNRVSSNQFKLMTMGRLEQVKGYDLLILAIRLLKEQGYTISLDIYGEGREREQLKHIIDSNDLSAIVKLKGFDPDAKSNLKYYDLYIQPSHYETFGLTLLEAMKEGVPVICSNVGGMKEIISDGENGFIIKEQTAESIVESILRAMSSDLSHIIETANERLPYFSAEQMSKSMSTIYNNL